MTIPAFHEILFPENISYGSSGGPAFKTTVFTADSGYEQRNVDWSQIRSQFNVSHGIKDQSQMDELTEFFFARRGRAYGFRLKDWNDYQIKNQLIGVGDDPGDGSGTAIFQLVKTYTSAQTESGESYTFTRNITKPNWNTVAGVTVGGVVKVSPTDYAVDYTTGLITFVVAPANDAEIIVGLAEFHVPVRFDTDHLDVTQEFWNTSSWPNIPLVEVRNWGEALV